MSNDRIYLAKNIDKEAFQQALAPHWKAETPDKQAVMIDASCYEVYPFPNRCETTLGILSVDMRKADYSTLSNLSNQATPFKV